MNDLIAMLQNSSLFRGLPKEVIQDSLLPQGTVRTFSKRTIITSPQDKIDWFGIIIDGRIQIAQIFSDGRTSLMNTLRPSYFLGADLICTKSQLSPYFAIAAEDVQLLSFPAKLILLPGILDDSDRLCVYSNLMTLLSHENMRKHYRLAILSQHGLRDRILTYLVMQARRRNTDSFRIPFSRDELADFLCVNRSALSHELSLMKQEGLIQFHKNQFTLLLHDDIDIPWD